MPGLFQSDPVHDHVLGRLTRRGGWWVGSLSLSAFGSIALRIAGGRKAPDPRSLDIARQVVAIVAAREAEIGHALYQHYLPGLDAWRGGELEDMIDSYPEITAPDDVWPHVRGERVDIDAAGPDFTIEIACQVAWDEEHLLGVRLSSDRVLEVCGSVL